MKSVKESTASVSKNCISQITSKKMAISFALEQLLNIIEGQTKLSEM